MDSWVFWILTCAFSLYFVMLLLDFNKPYKKLVEQIDAQQARRVDMQQRLNRAQEEATKMRSHEEEMEYQWEELEKRRKELLPEANRKRMIRVTAGSFTMGGRDEDSPNNERPAHAVQLSTYYISPFPITNQDYREFVNCTGHKAPIHWQRGTYPTGMARHPVVNVSWHDAREYAEWVGARLLTEAEWEKAARSSDERPYPWGSRFAEGERCNCNSFVGMTTPVDEFPDGRSPHGVWDMVGNAYEWCADYYDEDYYKYSPATNPKGPEGGQERVVRGGSFAETRAAVRCTHRVGAGDTVTKETIGFRVAFDVAE